MSLGISKSSEIMRDMVKADADVHCDFQRANPPDAQISYIRIKPSKLQTMIVSPFSSRTFVLPLRMSLLFN